MDSLHSSGNYPFHQIAVDHGLPAERPNGGVMPTHRITRLDPPIPQRLGRQVFFGPGGFGGHTSLASRVTNLKNGNLP